MLIRFFYMLKVGGIPVSITEFLALLEALKANVAGLSAEQFYFLARTVLIKDERFYDRFDRIFAAHFQGLEAVRAGRAPVRAAAVHAPKGGAILIPDVRKPPGGVRTC